MGTQTRIPLLILVCAGLTSLCASAQRQGQILERRAAQPTAAEESNADQTIQGPVLGFVYGGDYSELRPALGTPRAPSFGARSELRPILGIPGASVLGAPVVVPSGVTGVYLAPSQNYALLAQSTAGFIGLMTFQGGVEGSLTAICGALSQPDIVSFSPSGNTAALYSKTEGRLQLITGLPDSPELARDIPRNDLPDDVGFLAVADDGVTLLEGTVHSALYLLPEGGTPRFLHSAEDLGGMVFAPGASDVVVYDRGTGTAFLLHEVNLSSSYEPLAKGLTGLSGNVFLQVNRGSAILGSANTNSLWQIDLQSLQVQNIHLPGLPLTLQPLRTSGDYLLFYQPGLPAWILDSNGEAGVVSLVPASTTAVGRPEPVPVSASGGLLADANEQPDLVSRPSFGSGCASAGRLPGRPGPLTPPRY
jgi:hypothetical protein